MHRLVRLALFALCLGSPVLHGAPAAPRSALYRPTFLWPDRSVTAGRGFLVRYGGFLHERTLLLSCFHVLGDHPGGLRGVAGLSAEERPRMIGSLRVLALRGQAVAADQRAPGELSAFVISDLPRGTARLTLSRRAPEPGEVVHLFSQVFGEASVRLHRARICQVRPDALDYVFDDGDLELGGTSGSPVLDEHGEVVGINVAGYRVGATLHGIANPAANVLAALRDALDPPGT